jgi:hypothetical protein
MCDTICEQILDTLVGYLQRVDVLSKNGDKGLAYSEGLTGYATLTILIDAYMSANMLSRDLYIRFKRALHIFKDFVESLKNSTISAPGSTEVFGTALEAPMLLTITS